MLGESSCCKMLRGHLCCGVLMRCMLCAGTFVGDDQGGIFGDRDEVEDKGNGDGTDGKGAKEKN